MEKNFNKTMENVLNYKELRNDLDYLVKWYKFNKSFLGEFYSFKFEHFDSRDKAIYFIEKLKKDKKNCLIFIFGNGFEEYYIRDGDKWHNDNDVGKKLEVSLNKTMENILGK